MYLPMEKTVFAFFLVLAFCRNVRVWGLDMRHAGEKINNSLSPSNESSLRAILDYADQFPEYNQPKKIQRRLATTSRGHYAFPGQFPWMAIVHHILGHSRHGVCGGTIISSRWILTAAHCLVKGPRKFFVVLGTVKNTGINQYRYSGNGYTFMSAEIVVHPHFRYNHETNDIGLILAPEKIPFNDFIQPIQLAGMTEARRNFVGETAMMLGWGRELPNRINSLAKTLKYTTVPIISNEECARTFGVITHSQVCTSGRLGSDICPGDSGGPLVIEVDDRYVQIGVISAGSDPCGGGDPAIFTRVTSFASWIRDIVTV